MAVDGDGGFEVAPNPTEEPAAPEEPDKNGHLLWVSYLHGKGLMTTYIILYKCVA